MIRWIWRQVLGQIEAQAPTNTAAFQREEPKYHMVRGALILAEVLRHDWPEKTSGFRPGMDDGMAMDVDRNEALDEIIRELKRVLA